MCFPFAGGAASVYRQWGASLPDHVDVCAVELPGRGTRFGEPPIHDPARLKEELALLTALSDLPVVYFGHSLGARIAFWLVHGGVRADSVIVSGARAAHLAPSVRSTLPRDAMVQELRRLGGTPREILDDEEMLDLVLPVVRADFRLLESLRVSEQDKIQCPLEVLAATDDAEAPLADAAKWQVHAGGKHRFTSLEGGHFYVVSRAERVLVEVRRVLDETLTT
ncbi:MAG TPA: alpha/beta fold hydrolase [Labilithrix sp.]|nr:alpha/beta fold hydrolase [Labilithrix sp.]